MNQTANQTFSRGVVEGFYGRPWTFTQRHKVAGWLKNLGLNTYLYGPKDDLKHRVLWRDLLDESEAVEFERVIAVCRDAGVRFICAIAPGWDAHFQGGKSSTSSTSLAEGLERRFKQLLKLGCRDFAVMFDDVPNLAPAELEGIAHRQADLANRLRDWLGANAVCQSGALALCPSVYCTRMAGKAPGDSAYLCALGEQLHPDVDVYWTGPEIISPTIGAEHLREVAAVLRRPPFIWDNLHANDYDCARVYLGPYADRTPELPALSRGVVINPNRECELNFIALATLGEFVRQGTGYVAEDALARAAADWLPEWERVTGEAFTPATVELVADCFHLPFRSGRRADALMESVRQVLREPSATISQPLAAVRDAATELGRLFFDLGAMRNRDLFEALWPHVWRLKDELGLVVAIGEQRERGVEAPCIAPDYPAGVFRGGLLGELRELIQPVEGGFRIR